MSLFEFDPDKDKENRRLRGLPLVLAAEIFDAAYI
jgi:uncharacterized DUF497 family protein